MDGCLVKLGEKRYEINVTKKAYSLQYTIGARQGDVWREGDTIEVDVSVSLATDIQLQDIQLKKIIHLNGVSANWARQGIVHDADAGTLDFSNYIYAETPGSGEFIGYIDFDFKAL